MLIDPDKSICRLGEEMLAQRQPGDLSWLQGPPAFDSQPRVIPLTSASNQPSDHRLLLPLRQRKEKKTRLERHRENKQTDWIFDRLEYFPVTECCAKGKRTERDLEADNLGHV